MILAACFETPRFRLVFPTARRQSISGDPSRGGAYVRRGEQADLNELAKYMGFLLAP